MIDSERDLAFCLMLKRRRPGILAMLPVATLECIDGPVLVNGNGGGRDVLRRLLEWVDDYAKRSRVGEIRWTAPAGEAVWSSIDSMSEAFTSMGYAPSPWSTLLVDLTQDEESLWQNLNRAARKSINKCIRQGIEVRKVRDFEDFRAAFLTPYTTAQEGEARSSSIFRVMFDEDVDQRYAYFIALDAEGETLATLGVHSFGGVAKEIASSLSPRAREAAIPAQDILHWHVLKWAKEQGSNTFDLAGVAPNPTDPKEEGIRRFKEKWGGRYVELHRFEKTLAPARLLRSTRRAFSGLSGRGLLRKAFR